jgi:hypothetical protein
MKLIRVLLLAAAAVALIWVLDPSFAKDVDAASNERLPLEQLTREQECLEKLVDEKHISIYHSQEWTARRIVTQVTGAPDVDDKRWARVMQMILDAHKYEGGPSAWFDNAWNACTNGK